jgi:hypothetical protein
MIGTLGQIFEPNGIGLHELEYVKIPHYILEICRDLLRKMIAPEAVNVDLVIRLSCIFHIV